MTNEEAITELRSISKHYIYITPNNELTALKMAIEALSAEAVQGEWVEEYDGFYYEYRCSVCGAMALTEEGTMHDQVCTTYCPNCGRKMTTEGGEDE